MARREAVGGHTNLRRGLESEHLPSDQGRPKKTLIGLIRMTISTYGAERISTDIEVVPHRKNQQHPDRRFVVTDALIVLSQDPRHGLGTEEVQISQW